MWMCIFYHGFSKPGQNSSGIQAFFGIHIRPEWFHGINRQIGIRLKRTLKIILSFLKSLQDEWRTRVHASNILKARCDQASFSHFMWALAHALKKRYISKPVSSSFSKSFYFCLTQKYIVLHDSKQIFLGDSVNNVKDVGRYIELRNHLVSTCKGTNSLVKEAFTEVLNGVLFDKKWLDKVNIYS